LNLIESGQFNNTGGTIENCLPALNKQYLNRAVFPGQQTRIFYFISNSTGSMVADVAFSDTLDSQLASGIVVSDAPSVINTCGGTLTASPGSSTVSLSGGSLASGTCLVAVNVNGVTTGIYDSPTSELSSNLGSGNAGQAVIEVLSSTGARAPIFNAQFSPNTIITGDNSVITYSIDNRNGPIVQNINFVNQLPSSINIASDPNLSTDCIEQIGIASFTATPGGNQIEVDNYAIPANSRCSFSVNVTTLSEGNFVNTTTDLTSDAGNSGFASSSLTVIPGSSSGGFYN